ncbi:hypothetical protein M769_0104740 [Bacillus haynesii]|nr:hypothetical protein M769_0104740 [Bacillus haynesii]
MILYLFQLMIDYIYKSLKNPCVISLKGLEEADDRFVLPEVHPELAPLVSVIPLQLIAYCAAPRL